MVFEKLKRLIKLKKRRPPRYRPVKPEKGVAKVESAKKKVGEEVYRFPEVPKKEELPPTSREAEATHERIERKGEISKPCPRSEEKPSEDKLEEIYRRVRVIEDRLRLVEDELRKQKIKI